MSHFYRINNGTSPNHLPQALLFLFRDQDLNSVPLLVSLPPLRRVPNQKLHSSIESIKNCQAGLACELATMLIITLGLEGPHCLHTLLENKDTSLFNSRWIQKQDWTRLKGAWSN